jgi:hypothetical protein
MDLSKKQNTKKSILNLEKVQIKIHSGQNCKVEIEKNPLSPLDVLSFLLGLFGYVPLQFSKVGDIPLQFTYFEIYHHNSLVPTKIPRNTF